MAPLTVDEIRTLTWLEIDLGIVALGAPRRAPFLAVLEGLLKGPYEESGLGARGVKQLWHVAGTAVDALSWQAGTRLALTLQFFGMGIQDIPHWSNALTRRFEGAKQAFVLAEVGAWRVCQSPAPETVPAGDTLCLNFLTPVFLPHRAGSPQTALDGAGFLRLCQTRLRKLFGREGALPPPPEIDTSAWHYWRAEHRSRSQNGNPMFLNGCVGPLYLMGETLAAWRPWIALFSAIGLGERLSFGQGRFSPSGCEGRPHATPEDAAAPLRIRRPFVLDAQHVGASLSLENDNLVVIGKNHPERRLPLFRLQSLTIFAPCTVSSPLLAACAREGIPVVFAAPGQTPLIVAGAHAEARLNRTLAAHHAAFASLDDVARVRLAARLVEAKLAAMALIIHRRYQAGDRHTLAIMSRARQSLARTTRLNIVRGWEGYAARHYHRWLARHLVALGEFTHRRQHGERQDPINALLNYGYALLRHRISVAVRQFGLDPYLGVLHAANGRHEALVSDLIEPWRAVVDRLVMRLVNLRIIQPDDFSAEGAEVRILPPARSRFVQEFTRLMEGTPAKGDGQLASRLEKSIAHYAAAVQEGRLAEWEPLPTYAEEKGSDHKTDDETST